MKKLSLILALSLLLSLAGCGTVDAGLLKGSTGTIPGAHPTEEFQKNVKSFNAKVTDFTYTAETYDAIVLAALAAQKGGATDGTTVQKNLMAVSGSTKGKECDSYKACLALLKDGKDVAIIANGDTVRLALEAAEVLAGKGISARVLDMHTIKPLDVEAVKACVNDIGKIITVEDHNIINGLGGAVCEVVAEMGKGQVKRVGIQDQFGQSAPYERLLAINGITVENIVAQAENW